MNEYMIPANSKKSKLILGFFTPTDLALFLTGAITTLILLLIFKNPTLPQIVIMLLPLLISTFLVLPVVYYHNVLQFIINFVTYITNNRRYYWRGWCVNDESKTK